MTVDPPKPPPLRSRLMSADLHHLAIALLFLTSGALGVVDEVLWARLLGLHLGHAATAHATVVATFLLGLGIGYAWLGGQADG